MSQGVHPNSEPRPGPEPGPGGTLAKFREGKRVLVVDDDPISRNIVRDLLCSRGFEVDGADGAQPTLEKVRRHHYELLILDIFLPGLDGRIVHGSIEKIAPGLAARTIFISHWVPTGAIGEYVAEHGVFLKKPFTAEELLRAIEVTIGAGTGPAPAAT